MSRYPEHWTCNTSWPLVPRPSAGKRAPMHRDTRDFIYIVLGMAAAIIGGLIGLAMAMRDFSN